jgi:hypothetical protein
MSLRNAWFRAGVDTQPFGKPNQAVWFRVAGWQNNFADMLLNYQAPDSGDPQDITTYDFKVYP